MEKIQMKTFKDLFEAPGAPATDNVPEPDTDNEVKGYQPRSKGEEQFANLHLVSKIEHPVAEPHQFNGEIKGIGTTGPEEHVGSKGAHAPGDPLEKVKEEVEIEESELARPKEKTPAETQAIKDRMKQKNKLKPKGVQEEQEGVVSFTEWLVQSKDVEVVEEETENGGD